MAALEELSAKRHGKLRLHHSGVMQVAATQHLVNLGVGEVPRAVSCFPVFLSRSPETGRWQILALTGLEPGQSLFVADGEWQAVYQPVVLQTHPLYPMAKPKGEGWTVGIDPESPALSEAKGVPLFDDTGQPSIRLQQLTSAIEAHVKQQAQTRDFCAALEEQRLIKPLTLNVLGEDGGKRFRGLSTIDELALQQLDAALLADWKQRGYLPPIYGLLMSIYQLNLLIQLRNKTDGLPKVQQVKLETEKQPQ